MDKILTKMQKTHSVKLFGVVKKCFFGKLFPRRHRFYVQLKKDSQKRYIHNKARMYEHFERQESETKISKAPRILKEYGGSFEVIN